MSSLAQQHHAINLGQGFPDYEMNPELIALVNEAMKKGNNQYVHMNGYMPLREALAEKIQFLYNNAIHPDTQITVTPGGTYALYTALTTILQPGDEVIVFEPAYDSYIPAIELNGAKAVPLQLTFPDYKIDWKGVKRNVTEKTRAIMINSPHNPTGSVLDREDIAQLRAIVKDTQIIIISDEVYEHLIFDGYQHESILKHPDLLQRSFVCFFFCKVYQCTGWEVRILYSFRLLNAGIQKNSPVQLFYLRYTKTGSALTISTTKGALPGARKFCSAKERLFS